jgi:hypothetical protein
MSVLCACVIGAAERHARIELSAGVDRKEPRLVLMLQGRVSGSEEHSEMYYCLIYVVSCS